MDYKVFVKNELRDYDKRKAGLKVLKQKLIDLKADFTTLKAVDFDEHIRSSENHAEDNLINNIVERRSLEDNIAWITRKVELMDYALSELRPEQRRILELFYIKRVEGYIDILCEELHIEKSQVYRDMNTALRDLTMIMYGIIDG